MKLIILIASYILIFVLEMAYTTQEKSFKSIFSYSLIMMVSLYISILLVSGKKIVSIAYIIDKLFTSIIKI
ncbi:hypothetical protein SAMN05444401_1818 [Clostridium amylolyticum]|uniref:Uncharacterized protein n=1 Tax=Clostridium amylolyticum TaxID=1121298 RepID=A0A1M6F5U9_9CLOT|nr:hypothetical protein [Clostridium amylolyticum]SHI93098.1 hypothetical protein SAMN05444401_1818 [Clostridium amylolyticum]